MNRILLDQISVTEVMVGEFRLSDKLVVVASWFCSFCGCCCLRFSSLCWKGRVAKGEIERKLFHLLVDSPNDHYNWNWARNLELPPGIPREYRGPRPCASRELSQQGATAEEEQPRHKPRHRIAYGILVPQPKQQSTTPLHWPLVSVVKLCQRQEEAEKAELDQIFPSPPIC